MMKKDDLIILLIGLLLLAGMIITVIFGGEKSLHGVGLFSAGKPGQHVSLAVTDSETCCHGSIPKRTHPA
jgi:hypothetical protein